MVKAINFDSESEWLDARKRHITATAVAKLMTSKAQWKHVARDRAGLAPSFSTAAIEWGHKREPEIQEWLRSFVDSRFTPNGHRLYVHDDGVLAATPDMVVDEDDELILAEIKTVTKDRAWPKPKDGAAFGVIPDQYWHQVQAQLLVTGAQCCFFTWEPHDGDTLFDVEYTIIKPDPQWRDECLKTIKEFLEWEKTANLDGDEASPEVASILEKLAPVRARYEAAKAEKDALEGALRDALGDVDTSLEAFGLKVTWSEVKPRKTFDGKRFSAEHPDLAQQFTSFSAPTRRLTIKKVDN